MIETGYFAKIKDYPESDVLICVARKYPWFVDRLSMVHLSALAPSEALLKAWKSNKINWRQYTDCYIGEMKNQLSENAIRSMRNDNSEVFRLMCWEKNPPCHRFILKELILEAEES